MSRKAARIAQEQEMMQPEMDKIYDKALSYYDKGNYMRRLTILIKARIWRLNISSRSTLKTPGNTRV